MSSDMVWFDTVRQAHRRYSKSISSDGQISAGISKVEGVNHFPAALQGGLKLGQQHHFSR
jgi:hypothetical protein